MSSGRQYLVGADDLATPAVSVAAALAARANDKVNVIHFSFPQHGGPVPTDVLDGTQVLLQKSQLHDFQWCIMHRTLDDGETVEEALRDAASTPSTVLVLGATGRGTVLAVPSQAKRAARTLGSISEACLRRMTGPLLLVQPGKPVPSGPGLTFAVLVDGGHTSKKTFDLAVRMCAEGDSLRVVHIARPQSEDEVEAARYFEGECDKLDAIQPGFRVDFEQIALGKATTLPSAVADFCEKNSCDLLFLASAKVEGAKGGPSLEPEILSLVRTGCAHMMVVKPFAR